MLATEVFQYGEVAVDLLGGAITHNTFVVVERRIEEA